MITFPSILFLTITIALGYTVLLILFAKTNPAASSLLRLQKPMRAVDFVGGAIWIHDRNKLSREDDQALDHRVAAFSRLATLSTRSLSLANQNHTLEMHKGDLVWADTHRSI